MKQHALRVVMLMGLTAGVLGTLAGRTAILFADGLRYIAQAQQIEQGSWAEGLVGAVDHPIYPLAIAAVHRWLDGTGPEAWQRAAQVASVLAGVLLVVPLYLVARELFGDASAWLGCLLVYLVPMTGHVFADTLSESTFLLFWTWGFWTALRFLREGRFGWLPLTIGFGALAYLSRPEGLLLPAALVASLVTMPLLRSTRLNWPRWWAAVAFLVIGPALLVGPYVAIKGGVGTKPAVARLLGLTPRSAAHAAERERPLDPSQTPAKTYLLATSAMLRAVRGAVTLPLLALAVVGLAASWPLSDQGRARLWLFGAIVLSASALALVRLHATGGYCSPRHALIPALVLIPCAGHGLNRLLSAVRVPGRWLGLGEGHFRAGPAVWALMLGGFVAWHWSAFWVPVNHGFRGYRDAADWLAENLPDGAPVADVTGWSQFYSERPGYTFANLHEAFGDPDLRWVVVREAHLRGPWEYCDRLRALVAGREPVAKFPDQPHPGQAQVYVFDRFADATHPARAARGPVGPERR